MLIIKRNKKFKKIKKNYYIILLVIDKNLNNFANIY